MAVKFSADELNSDYNFLNISARDLMLVSNLSIRTYYLSNILIF